MKEEWKEVPGFPGLYASSLGNVKTNKHHLKQRPDTEGYMRVCFGGKVLRVHRLVALAFVKNPKNKELVNHIDMDKANNIPLNLEWVTAHENSIDAGGKGAFPKPSGKTPIVVQNIVSGYIKEFESQKEAAGFLGITDSEINKCLRGKRVSSHGYKFIYGVKS